MRAAHLLHDGRLVDVLAAMGVSAAAVSAGESAAEQHSIEVKSGARENCLRCTHDYNHDYHHLLLLGGVIACDSIVTTMVISWSLLLRLYMRVCRFPLSLSTVGVSLYSIYYLTLEPLAGLAWIGSVGLPSLVGAFVFRHVVPSAWMYALLLHIFGWYLQVAVASFE